MTEIDTILLTSSLTITGSVIVFVLSQLLSKFILDPLINFRLAIGELIEELLYSSDLLLLPGFYSDDQKLESYKSLLKSNAKLNKMCSLIPFYNFFSFLKIVPSKDDLLTISKDIIVMIQMFRTKSQYDYLSTINSVLNTLNLGYITHMRYLNKED